MAAETSYHLKLPEDLLIEIFLRSPVKSLLRAKCVCKHWFSLISNTDFVHKHLKFQKSHDKSHLFLRYLSTDTQHCTCVVYDDETLESNSYRKVGHIQVPWPYLVHLEGPVNGLYCFFNGLDLIVLWNPALMEARIIPPPQSHFFPPTVVMTNVIGFGLDPLTHHYKLVLIRCSEADSLSVDDIFTATVYNLTTDTWKLLNLDHIYFGRRLIEKSLNSSFLDGMYYWCTSALCSDQPRMFIAFDMGEETFRGISGPILDDRGEVGSLIIYNDKVAYIQQDQWHSPIDFWVMLEEGIWIKQISVTSLPYCVHVRGLWKNDGLLVAKSPIQECQMVLHNVSTQEMRSLGPKGKPLCFQPSTYYESLVSVYSGTRHNERHASLDTLRDFFSMQQ